MLTVDDLARQRYEKALKNHETYKEMLQEVLDKVSRTAETDHTSTSFSIPMLTRSHSRYNVQHAVSYIRKKLEQNGYKVEVRQDLILIDWSVVHKMVQDRIQRRQQPTRVQEDEDAWRFRT